MSITGFFATHPVFTRDEFLAAHASISPGGGPRAPDKALSYHLATGRLLRVKRGLYTVVPPGHTAETFRPDAYLVASRFADDAVVGYHTALELHGLAQSVLRRLTFCTARDVRPVTFQGLTFAGVRPPGSVGAADGAATHVMTVNRQGLDVRLTDLERTVVDVLDRLETSGGWDEVTRSLAHVRVLDARAATDYALWLGRAATAAKLGLFLHQRQDDLFVDQAVLDALTEARPRRTHRVERGHRGPYRTVPRWRLSVPEAMYDPAWAELQ